ncbi:MAG: hypothetical protein ABI882_05370, partial [Acidobacteriota bacterium]
MSRPKRKLTAQQKAEKKRRRQEYMIVFVRGKQTRVKRPPTIDGMSNPPNTQPHRRGGTTINATSAAPAGGQNPAAVSDASPL